MARTAITGFANSPDHGVGLARDMVVRWALEEVGQPYDMRLLTFEELKEPEHRARQPFGQIPTLEEPGLTLFETGAIVLHIAETHPGLLPADGNVRARAIAWMFAAKSTVEPVILEREAAMITERDKNWYDARRPLLDERVGTRLTDLSNWLVDRDWLDGDFSAADLLMISALRRSPGIDGLLDDRLKAYVARGEGRPAFLRAYTAQHATFVASQPQKKD